jgi:hypothetical protein
MAAFAASSSGTLEVPLNELWLPNSGMPDAVIVVVPESMAGQNPGIADRVSGTADLS